GNVFNNGLSVTGGSADRLNNIEQVLIENPGSSATITVNAFQIAGSVLLDQPGVATAQHFALVCQNCLQQPDFTLDLSPTAVAVCVPDSTVIDVEVGSLLGFTNPVNLSVSGLPTGVSGNWDNPVAVPPTSQLLTLNATGAAQAGNSLATVSGTSTTGLKEAELALNLFDQSPVAGALLSPANGAINLDPSVTLSWAAVPQAGGYVVDVATDAAFVTIVETVSTEATTIELSLDTSTQYYWRVGVSNACGSDQSVTASFTTRPEPGDCPIGVPTAMVFFDDVEGGDNGWVLGNGGTGSNTWERTQVDAASGAWSWHADAPAAIADQSLVSPTIDLPGVAELPITLRYENRQVIEDANGACWDGAILEVSTDDGNNWQQIDTGDLLSQPYDGTVNTFNQGPNPLAGLEAWCGDPAPWQESTVDLSDFAGESIQLRFRIGTDSTQGREGWYVDDFRVDSCRGIELFEDSFESPE
ncbi:MAG: hypothetical protein AAGH65_11760, partial [Pseudomonadota bacterium]